jgi:hypothetical protein
MAKMTHAAARLETEVKYRWTGTTFAELPAEPERRLTSRVQATIPLAAASFSQLGNSAINWS